MSKKTITAKVDDLAQEAANIPASDGTTLSDEVANLLARLAKENDAMKEEMQAMKKSVQKTMKLGKEELKSEIAHHPVQSVATAFALGLVASLFLRR